MTNRGMCGGMSHVYGVGRFGGVITCGFAITLNIKSLTYETNAGEGQECKEDGSMNRPLVTVYRHFLFTEFSCGCCGRIVSAYSYRWVSVTAEHFGLFSCILHSHTQPTEAKHDRKNHFALYLFVLFGNDSISDQMLYGYSSCTMAFYHIRFSN